MPEGHMIHRLARQLWAAFGGRAVAVSSPQGRFAAGAARLNGSVFLDADAHGKHLFLGFAERGSGRPRGDDGLNDNGLNDDGGVGRWVHVHLGLYGKFRVLDGPAAEPWGEVRMRLDSPSVHADLRGPTRCELIGPAEKAAVHGRLGPDPIRGDDPTRALARIGRSRAPIGVLLMDQSVVAGVGNAYRAEVLFRAGVDPAMAGRDVDPAVLAVIWADLVDLMTGGVETGRIDTVRPEHEPEVMGRPPRVDPHGGEVYVYRRAGRACYVCGTEIRTREAAARNLFWCPTCQA